MPPRDHLSAGITNRTEHGLQAKQARQRQQIQAARALVRIAKALLDDINSIRRVVQPAAKHLLLLWPLRELRMSVVLRDKHEASTQRSTQRARTIPASPRRAS